jgi:hypothetical protein
MTPYIDMALFFVAFFGGMFSAWFLGRGHLAIGNAIVLSAWAIYFTVMALQRRKDRAL